jgi:hypothetical protein
VSRVTWSRASIAFFKSASICSMVAMGGILTDRCDPG